MEIDNMSIESIEAHLKGRKEREEKKKFVGGFFNFIVNKYGHIVIEDVEHKKIEIISSLPTLYKAVELSKERSKR